jgi:hypothetical protein
MGTTMSRPVFLMLTGTALAAALAITSAAQAQTQRVLGTIEGVDGAILVVKLREGGDVRVVITEGALVFGVVRATLADIKPGAFIGVGAMPQADGSQKAIQLTIFAETQRGTGEGHRPWTRPGSTMTNATVDSTVAGLNGQELVVKYKDGEKKIIVSPEAIIRAYVAGSRSELKPGASIAIFGAVKKPDGSLEAARVNVGRDGVVP